MGILVGPQYGLYEALHYFQASSTPIILESLMRLDQKQYQVSCDLEPIAFYMA